MPAWLLKDRVAIMPCRTTRVMLDFKLGPSTPTQDSTFPPGPTYQGPAGTLRPTTLFSPRTSDQTSGFSSGLPPRTHSSFHHNDDNQDSQIGFPMVCFLPTGALAGINHLASIFLSPVIHFCYLSISCSIHLFLKCLLIGNDSGSLGISRCVKSGVSFQQAPRSLSTFCSGKKNVLHILESNAVTSHCFPI